ncbi:MAG TPA: cyclopropane-fatty-acyl-phospholipid synthase family protein [Anaeromyxobacter sp.]|nr:cyclopropane-fatty-acyl-phospholipid synthase family protein [Anaeromyxobacter sp.]
MTSTTLPAPLEIPSRPRGSVWRRAVLAGLAHLRDGTLEFEEGGARHRLGEPGDLVARVTVRDPRFWRRVALGGSLGAGEAYADGDWDADDLTALVRLLVRSGAGSEGLDGSLSLLRRPLDLAFSLLRRNSRRGARRNIADHYDLGNDFFALMLDPTMTYSSAVWDLPRSTLEGAQIRKLDLLCTRLRLRPEDRLLEIGTGWGSLALHAARRYGCRVTTTTLSAAQHALASERVRAAGLQDRVTLLREDYRDLRGRYDKIVSCEMIEAVGAAQYPTFFARCAALLAPGGLLALQAITIADRHYDRARREVDFIKRHVFPGSCIPSITALTAAAAESDLLLRQLQDHGRDYARTLAAWRENLAANRAAVERLTDERFRRLWHFYLGYCEGGFAEGHIGVAQMTFARPGEG